MNDKTPDNFESAMADVFEGRETQLSYGSRKILREFYDRALKDARPTSTSSVGRQVRSFRDLKVGDVFQNCLLQGYSRCRRVIAVISADEIETEIVSTQSKRVIDTEFYSRKTFESYCPYYYITDPG